MADIVVDTYSLGQYAQRLGAVNRRISDLDWRLKTLYSQVSLKDLFTLIQADALTGFSWRLLSCQAYLNETAGDFERAEEKLTSQDPTDFHKPPVTGIAEVVYDVGVAVKKGAEKVKGLAEKVLTDALDSYFSYGWVYEAVQTGKVVLKAAKGVAKIATGVAAIFGSAGSLTPVAILEIISGANDVYNAIMDGTYLYTGDYDKIGTNALKDRMAEGGGIIGKLFGNEKIGGIVGQGIYYGIDLVTSLQALSFSVGKIKQLSSTKLGVLGSDLKKIGQLDISGLLTMNFGQLRYEAKLAGYTFSAAANFLENAGELYKVGKNAVKLGKSIDKIFRIGVGLKGSNPNIGYLDTISDMEKKIGKGIKWVTKTTKFVFG